MSPADHVLVNGFPRLPLPGLPTPLTFLPRLSAALDRPVYIKRDDDLGRGMGGNKTRKLAYQLAHAQQQGARKVVTFGGLQSNHARLTAALANQLGLEPHLFYFERRPDAMRGNLLLNELLGARMHFVPLGAGGGGSLTLETTNRLVHLLATLRLGRHYFIPVGGHNWRGALGYVEAAQELHDQALAAGLERATVITAAGTGGTLAGLWAGLTFIGSSIRPLGIDVGKLWQGFGPSIRSLALETLQRLPAAAGALTNEVPLIEGRYVGERYGVPSAAGQAALRRLARSEGVLLDPIYTGKAFAGLLDLVESGQIGRDEPLIFLHTGGVPALFAVANL